MIRDLVICAHTHALELISRSFRHLGRIVLLSHTHTHTHTTIGQMYYNTTDKENKKQWQRTYIAWHAIYKLYNFAYWQASRCRDVIRILLPSPRRIQIIITTRIHYYYNTRYTYYTGVSQQ